jgi:hypothetical protein
MEDVHNGGGEIEEFRRFSWRGLAVTLLIITAAVLVIVAFFGMNGADASAAGGCGGG